jgi:hypothetical protein
MRKRWIPLAIAAFLVFIALGGQVVHLLWNWLMPPLFGWPAITFWQALGLLALCRILFGGFGRHGSGRSYRGRMDARWERMTPEERERFRAGMRGRYSCAPSEPPTPRVPDSTSPESPSPRVP